MTVPSERCPTPEVIAAFVAGNLHGTELSMTAEHLRLCEDCREIVADAARIDREGVSPVEETKPRTVSPWWLAAAAAALAGVVFLAYQAVRPRDVARGEIRELVAAAPREGRYLEARVSGGFAWAPLRGQQRSGTSTLDPAHMKLIGAAGAVLQKVATDNSENGRHVAAVAHLLAGDAKQAATLLTPAVSEKSEAEVWSDLAAARYTASLESGDSAQLTEALAAADTALRRDPKLPEALFNRALIIERLGLRDLARAAWQRYLGADPSSPWAKEAEQHLRSLRPEAGFREELQNNYPLLQKDSTAARKLAQRYPQEARVWGETEILARWAESTLRGDPLSAQAHLQVALTFAETLAPRGDMMLMGAVRAIERSGPAQRVTLANAHLEFRAGQRIYRDGQPAAAEASFAHAIRDFTEGNSPLALSAAYFRANTMYDQGRVPESRTILEQLMATAPAEYPSHRAQLGWQLGLVKVSLGHWGDALRTFNESVAVFERLGEIGYAHKVRSLIAEMYERFGERRVAWNHRIVALRAIGKGDKYSLSSAVDAAARGAAVNRNWPVTLSLLGLHLEILADDGDEFMHAETLIDRARIQARLGERAAASADLMSAREFMGKTNDDTVRARIDADLRAAEALLVPPAEAIAPLTRAIEFHRGRGRSMFLPELFLQRGRALAAVQKTHEAAQDFDHGIREIDAQHKLSGPGVAVAEELYDQAMATALQLGDVTGAFAYAERARSQVASAPRASPAMPARAHDGEVVIEYASMPDQLVIFVVDRNGVRAVSRNISRLELTARVERMMAAAMENDVADFRRASNAVYEQLVQPITRYVAASADLVFVPDATLSIVPFAALVEEDGRYVIEKHRVVVTPSHAWYQSLRARRASPAAHDLRLLIIEGPSTRDGERAWFGRREAQAVASQYRIANVLPPGSERAEFESRASQAQILHFVGHAIMPDASEDAALVTSAESGTHSRLGADEIATMRLSRTEAVILAACGTARGRQVPGETRSSIASAFLSAGVPSVVATLWPIDDGSAAEFFPRVHSLIARGRSPADALRATQLEWIQRPDARPGMWAAVQIIGI